jgi:hypothetical protein
MTEFKKGVALQARPLLLVVLIMHLWPTTLRAASTRITDLRFGNNKGYIRVVMEFDRPLNPTPSVSIDRNILQVTLTGIINNLSDPQIGIDNGDVISLDVSQKSDVIQIDAVFSFAPADVKTFSLIGPDRFIIDAYRPLSPANGIPTVEKARRIAPIEETVSLPEPASELKHSPPARASTVNDEASAGSPGSAYPRSGQAEDLRRYRFQQRLLAALIVVTSIIAVLLFLLIWMGNSRKKKPGPSWIRDLPPTTDRDIESIDAVIGEHLKKP